MQKTATRIGSSHTAACSASVKLVQCSARSPTETGRGCNMKNSLPHERCDDTMGGLVKHNIYRLEKTTRLELLGIKQVGGDSVDQSAYVWVRDQQ